MALWRVLGLWAALAGLSGCKLDIAKAGAPCARSTQCVAGLACVKGKCSKDLSSIAAMNTVPMFSGSGGAQEAAGMSAGAAGDAAQAQAGSEP
jgi:hypothetical protein